MKSNIIYLYIVYILVLYLLCVIDITTLMYYIYGVSNIFIYPLLGLGIKIVYYNRTILLLLFFYYFIAKFTIKELGYKYIYFFKVDIKKWRSVYLNHIGNITTYHIEIVSIFLFFLVIFIPLFVYNKHIIILIGFSFIFIISWLRIIKNRFKFIMRGKRSNIIDFLVFGLILFFSFKIFNYYNVKGIMTTYIHLDKGVFELLEGKIQMYEKIMEKDYYSETVGLKPHWVGHKIKFEDEYNKKIFNKGDFLIKKKENLVKYVDYILKREKKRYYLYTKYYQRAGNTKLEQASSKIEYLRESFLDKNIELSKKNKQKSSVKEYTPRVDTSRENPVVTEEKGKERVLHRAVLLSNIFEFSLVNYYKLNHYLKDLTSNKLYYQPFMEKKNINKQLIYARKDLFYNIKEKVVRKDDLHLVKLILKKIKDNEKLLKEKKKVEINDSIIFNKVGNFILIEKKNNFFFKFFIKIFKIDDKIIYKKKEKLNIEKFLKKVGKNVLTNKTDTLDDSKIFIINQDKSKEVKKEPFVTTSRYVKKEEIEKIDNKAIFNTVKRYNEDKTKVNWKKEFSESFVLKEKKGNLNTSNGPDLSRRNKS